MANKNRWAKYVFTPTVAVVSTLALIGGVSPVAQAQTADPAPADPAQSAPADPAQTAPADAYKEYEVPCIVESDEKVNEDRVVTEEDLTKPEACTVDIQGAPQHSTDRDTGDVPLLPSEMVVGLNDKTKFSLELEGKTVQVDEPLEVTREIAPGVTATATYVVAENGVVTFTPKENFVGAAPKVTILATVESGDVYEGTYQAFVIPDLEDVTITAATIEPGQEVVFPFDPATGIDPESILFGDYLGEPTTSITVEGEGEWTVNSDGTITFTAASDFTKGSTSVSYIAKSRDGVPAYPATLTVTVADKAAAAGGSAEAGEWIKKILPFTPLLLIPLLGGIFGSSATPVVPGSSVPGQPAAPAQPAVSAENGTAAKDAVSNDAAQKGIAKSESAPKGVSQPSGLANTGVSGATAAFVLAVMSMIAGLGVLALRRKQGSE